MTGDVSNLDAVAARLDAVAARHGFSRGAVLALADAMRRGGGGMAQFSHPELGGMGQWSRGGLLQIGAMSDHALKARVAAAIADLAGVPPARAADPAPGPADRPGRDGPWPPELGQPSASGGQDGMRYAYFAQARRLAVVEGGRVTLYDTGRHRITGVSQSQAGGGVQPRRLVFASSDGPVDVGLLRVVGTEALTRT